MAWIDTTYVDNLIGSTQRTAVAPSTSVFNQFESSARSNVIAVLQYAGYASPGSTLTSGTDATAFLQMLCAAQWCRSAFGNRKGLKFPPAITDAFELLNAVYEKRLPVPGMQPSTVGGYGGIRASATTGDSARAQEFSRSKLSGF